MKLWIATIAMLSLTGMVWADDMDDAYTALKEAQSANNVDDILKWAPETAKLAKAEAARAKPDNMKDEDWKARVEFAKQADTFAEYSLATAAMQPNAAQAKIVALVDALLTLNPKSEYMGQASGPYIAALEKTGGAAKSMEGATKILNADPNSEDALFALMNGSYGKNAERAEQYANKLVAVMRSKAKPEGVPEADWTRKKDTMLAYGYYYAGLIPATGSRPSYPECDKNLRAGLPYITKQSQLTGVAYFYLGLCNYQISKLTNDKGKLQEAYDYTQKAAAIAGPMQGQAQQNSAVMQRELGTAARPAAARPAAKGKSK